MSVQQTLTGEHRELELACEPHGDGCDAPASVIVDVTLGAAQMEMALCENCRNVVVGYCDEFHGERELTDQEILNRAENSPSRQESAGGSDE